MSGINTEIKRGRVFIAAHTWSLNLPRLRLCADGDTFDIALEYGNGASDPVLLIDLDLTGSRAGKVLNETYWRTRELAGR